MKKGIIVLSVLLMTACNGGEDLVEDNSDNGGEEIVDDHSGDSVHVHAGFQVYVDDQLQDFSNFKFMHIMPCSEPGEGSDHEENAEEEQMEKAHLHDGVGNVVHSHRAGAVWGDLFENISFELGDPIDAYINDEPVKDFLKQEIGHFDSAVILVGENMDIEGKRVGMVTEELIQEIDEASEDCGGG